MRNGILLEVLEINKKFDEQGIKYKSIYIYYLKFVALYRDGCVETFDHLCLCLHQLIFIILLVGSSSLTFTDVSFHNCHEVFCV